LVGVITGPALLPLTVRATSTAPCHVRESSMHNFLKQSRYFEIFFIDIILYFITLKIYDDGR
jgi:hypothetical protein